eukprot:TRINITY_DN24035_c0_g2_i3.p1 TRINITY_DN24035_c0_g2~~TRINITY_DN24035_c0_g2_i3.p1  ORF type:complete len:531 (-),score=79.35 TRINITY_DN24035_c0_g2_i3:118-1710(-)
MIEYDEGRWSVSFAFRLTGSVIPRAVAWAFPTAIGCMLCHTFLRNSGGWWEQALSEIGGDVLRGFTFVLGFLIVFRAQKAYARWWEGGTLLQQLRGEWFNAVSNLIAFCNAAPESREDVQRFQHQVVRLFSLLYGSALRQVSTMDDKSFEFINLDGFDPDHIEFLADTHDECELVVQWIQRLIVEANTADIIKIAPPILSRVYNQLGNGIVRLNNAKKIKDFPIPFPLAQMITFMLMIHLITTSVICATSMSSVTMAGVVSFVVIVSFWGVNYLAVELENPYGDDTNDLPLHDMQRDMNRSLRSLLHPKAVRPPVFDFQSSRDAAMTVKTFDMAELLKSIPSARLDPAVAQRFKTLRVSAQFSLGSENPISIAPEEKSSALAQSSVVAEQLPADAPVEKSASVKSAPVENCLDGVCDAGGATVGNSQDSSYGDLAASVQRAESLAGHAISLHSPLTSGDLDSESIEVEVQDVKHRKEASNGVLLAVKENDCDTGPDIAPPRVLQKVPQLRVVNGSLSNNKQDGNIKISRM